jgi:hypothetical protein
MTETLILDPLVPMVALYVLAGLALFGVALAVWRRLAGWWLRALAAIAILAAVANPSVQSEDRAPLSDIVIALVDESASQRISDRPEQSATALETLSGQLARMPNTELRGRRWHRIDDRPIRGFGQRAASPHRWHRGDHGRTRA